MASIFSNKFFSAAGQKERLQNILRTYRMIGSNLIRGRVFTSVPVSPDYKGTIVGGASKVLTAPAGTLGVPAAGATAYLYGGSALIAAGGRISSLRAGALAGGRGVVRVIGRAGNKVIRFVGSKTALRAAGITAAAGLAYTGIKSFGQAFQQGGIQGVISGTPTTTTTIPDPSNPDGPGITVETTGDATPPNITFMMDPEGNLIPYIAGQGQGESSFYEDSLLGKAGVPSWTVPALVIGGLAVAVYASRKRR